MKNPNLEPMTIRVSEKLHNDLRALAARKGEFLYVTVEKILSKEIEKEKGVKSES